MAESAPVTLKVKRLRDGAAVPTRGTAGASGLDLYACIGLGNQLTLTGDPMLVPSGIAIEVPVGYDVQVRPRSGLSSRGVIVAFGTVDADYRGELFVTMYVVGSRQTHTIQHGDRIAQLVVVALPALTVVEVATLSNTERGAGGFGSTGS